MDKNNGDNNNGHNNDTINWWNIEFNDEEADAASRAIRMKNISQGELTLEFEQKLADILKVPYVVCTTSGSMALLMAYMALGIKPGDEIIIPNRTFIATAHAALILGAKVVLVDTREDIPIIDVSKIREKITNKTKMIVPVHLNGRSADMNEIKKIAEENRLYVVEDTAQGLLSKNEMGFIGTQGDIGCFSLGMTKLISTGQGGFVVTKNKNLYEKLKLLRTHGVIDPQKKYSYNEMGFNFRYNDILASVGLVQLKKIGEHINHIKEIYQKYETAFKDFPFIKLIPVNVSKGEIPLWVEVLSKERENIITFLNSHNISTRYFLPNLNLSPHLKNKGEFPNSKIYEEQGFDLPCGPNQPLENIDKVINVLKMYKSRY